MGLSVCVSAWTKAAHSHSALFSRQVNKQTTLSDKEKKKEIKRIQKLITDGKKKKTISEDDILDLELKLEELKTAP